MSKVHHFSEEILLMIFEDLDFEDLQNCQQMCRSWYLSAHTLMLRNVDFENANEIQRFITSIDFNPKPLFLNAVKTITIQDLDVATDDVSIDENSNEQVRTGESVLPVGGETSNIKVESEDEQEVNFQLPLWHDKENLKKLIARFPNLEELHIVDSLDFVQKFDDDLCETILESCPKLNKVTFSAKNYKESPAQYCDALCKVRLLVTTVYLNEITNISRFGTVAQFLTSFPRLNKIVDFPAQLYTFEKWLPVFEQLPNLTEFRIASKRDDQQSFVQKYLVGKSEDEEDALKDRLSAVKALYWRIDNKACLNSMKFIARYLKELQSLSITGVFKERWSDMNQLLFCNVMLDLLAHVNDCTFAIKMKVDTLSEYLPIIVNSTFFRADAHDDVDSDRILQVYVKNTPLEVNLVKVTITNKSQRKIQITVGNDHILDKIATTLFGKTFPVEDVDEFLLEFEDRQKYTKKVNTETYLKLIKGIPCVRTLSLDIPSSYRYVESEKTIVNEQLVFVNDLIIVSDIATNIQMLLDSCCPMLPNLNCLEFSDFCGVWAQNLGELQIVMPGYTLETLRISTMSVKAKTLQHLKKEKLEEGDFAVLLVELLDGGERPLYKISLHDFSITRVHNKDLKGFIRGEDYLRIHITIRSLQTLVIFYPNDNDADSWDSHILDIIENNDV